MAPTLRLSVTGYVDPTRWRWELSDSRGRFLADHDVHLDPASREYAGFVDLCAYLAFHQPIYSPEVQLADVGEWIGEQVFGGLRDALWQHCSLPAVAVQVSLPQVAQELLLRPFELARFADGKPFREAGVRFVYQLEGAPDATRTKRPVEKALRVLAAFSLPGRANPLNLRRERYGLQRLVRELKQVRGLSIELRVLQYGATRALLQDAIEEGEGWDIIHLSGHGARGELLLEDDQGDSDIINADELGALLDPARARLKLLILDACYSGAGSHLDARAQLGLDQTPTRQEDAKGEAPSETAQTALPGLAQALSGRLDCAALAMRYPVGAGFATELMLSLYEKLLDRRRPLPAALHLALDDALEADILKPPLSPVTAILVGPRAADLRLAPPQRPAQGFDLPTVGLGIAFPPEPERFVGRLQPMLRASQALAPRSAKRGVLFYGMPGAGKTACALELAYRHAERRFRGYVWYRAPEADSDITNALFNLMQDIQTQLNAPQLGLTMALDDPEQFRAYTLPRLRALLGQTSLLLVLDNLETLLTRSNRWRDTLWGDVVGALLSHGGPSRVVFTSRRMPDDLVDHPRLQVEAIHALSFAESVLLARELPHLKRLFGDEGGRALLRETLRVVQGHPKLLELADSLAADRAALKDRVAAAADELADRADVLDAFFAVGVPREGETQQDDADFVRALQKWTSRIAAGLSPTAGLLLAFLCRMEPEDRQQGTVETVWPHFLTRLGEGRPVAVAAMAEPEGGLPAALRALQSAGLVAVDRPQFDPAQMAGLQEMLAALAGQGQQAEGLDPAALLAGLAAGTTTYTVHPGVAEAVRAAAEPAALDAADVELGNFHIAMYQQGLKDEMEGRGGTVTSSARRAAPYLLRQTRWEEATTMLETMLMRDPSPDSLAFALPLQRRVVEATAGTERELIDAGVLAKALRMAGRTAEVEQMLRDIIARSAAQGDYRLATASTGDLLNLLRMSGRLVEALAVAEEMAGYTHQAGLGPWTQLLNESMRLQVLAAMGRYDEVLTEVEVLRPGMETLPLEGEAEEAVDPWNVREVLLSAGAQAAVYSERWEVALALNAEIVSVTQARGADALELARTRFNDYGPLLSLGRTADARRLLLECRAVYEAERDVVRLGKVYGALADLEDETGDRAAALRFTEVALGYSYQADQPEDCAITHDNLASYLEHQGADPDAILAHRLAACVIGLQIQWGEFSRHLRNLANSDLPPAPPPFAAVTDRVEAVEGVRFRALFERLPRTAPNGDAALAAVWQLVEREKGRGDEERLAQEAVLASLPAAVRAAFALEGETANSALRAALAELPEQEAQAILRQLREAGLIGGSAGPDIEQVLREFEPLLRGIAAAAAEESLRGEIEPAFARLEKQGWMLSDAARRIWGGERDVAALTEGIDGNSTQLVRRVLQLLEE
jgi:hypothetical protein